MRRAAVFTTLAVFPSVTPWAPAQMSSTPPALLHGPQSNRRNRSCRLKEVDESNGVVPGIDTGVCR
jgi:hypothetical protein